MRSFCAHEKRVAVLRAARDISCRDRAVGSRPGLDHDALIERNAEMLGDEPRDGVGGAPGTKWDDDRDRLARIGFRIARRARGEDAGEKERVSSKPGTTTQPTAHST